MHVNLNKVRLVLITDDSDYLFQWGGFWFLQWSDDSSKGKTLERQVRMENEFLNELLYHGIMWDLFIF